MTLAIRRPQPQWNWDICCRRLRSPLRSMPNRRTPNSTRSSQSNRCTNAMPIRVILVWPTPICPADWLRLCRRPDIRWLVHRWCVRRLGTRFCCWPRLRYATLAVPVWCVRWPWASAHSPAPASSRWSQSDRAHTRQWAVSACAVCAWPTGRAQFHQPDRIGKWLCSWVHDIWNWPTRRPARRRPYRCMCRLPSPGIQTANKRKSFRWKHLYYNMDDFVLLLWVMTHHHEHHVAGWECFQQTKNTVQRGANHQHRQPPKSVQMFNCKCLIVVWCCNAIVLGKQCALYIVPVG